MDSDLRSEGSSRKFAVQIRVNFKKILEKVLDFGLTDTKQGGTAHLC